MTEMEDGGLEAAGLERSDYEIENSENSMRQAGRKTQSKRKFLASLHLNPSSPQVNQTLQRAREHTEKWTEHFVLFLLAKEFKKCSTGAETRI